MIVLKNGKIIAVEKNFLNSLNTTLENISNLIKSIELEISSIKDSPITINNKTFNVEEIELLSLEKIKIFKLLPQEKKEEFGLQISPLLEEINLEPIEPSIKIEEPEIKKESEKSTLIPETNVEITPSEPKISLETDLIKEKKTEDLEFKSMETEFKPIEIETEFKPMETEFKPIETELKEEKDLQKESILEDLGFKPIETEIEVSKEPSIQQTEPTIKPIEEEEISISFEDEFSEIEEFLNLSKEEAQNKLEKELKQAASDLSIDLDTIYELKNELFEMFKTEKKSLLNAINEEDFETVHAIAHKLKGAALNLRLTDIAIILKKIDELSKAKKDIHKIKYLAERFYLLLDKIDVEKKTTIPKEIKNLILQTVQDYLENQNEKKFKKDKKYIEKLLNVKIESIEDLQKILKEN